MGLILTWEICSDTKLFQPICMAGANILANLKKYVESHCSDLFTMWLGSMATDLFFFSVSFCYLKKQKKMNQVWHNVSALSAIISIQKNYYYFWKNCVEKIDLVFFLFWLSFESNFSGIFIIILLISNSWLIWLIEQLNVLSHAKKKQQKPLKTFKFCNFQSYLYVLILKFEIQTIFVIFTSTGYHCFNRKLKGYWPGITSSSHHRKSREEKHIEPTNNKSMKYLTELWNWNYGWKLLCLTKL